MMRRGLWCGLLVAAVAGGAGPVLGQDMALRIPPPPTVQSLTGAFRVQWQDLPPGAVEQRLMSFAWYYATKADGSDKVRVTTSVRDDFSNFRANWTCPGPFPFDWSLGKHPKKGTWLNGAKGASPLFSNNAIAANSVVSVKVRPALGKQEWGVDLRVQKANQGIQFRADGIRMRILESDNFLDGFNVPTAPAWYWYEFGLQNKKGNDVEIRVRVFNEERTALLASYCKTHRLTKN
ncbi:MAG: hypothetical protein K0Q72_5131, partial [Armatimonadetes bacterium]|nr:hypothetical protein [Armatimonadota bacterium]